MNQSKLAEALSVTRQTVAAWDREGLAEAARISARPVDYDELKAFRWAWANKRKEGSSATDAKTRKLEAEAAMKELELEVQRGELVAVSIFDDVYGERLDRLRGKIVAFKGSMAPRIVGIESARDAKPILDEAFDELLQVLRPDNGDDRTD